MAFASDSGAAETERVRVVMPMVSLLPKDALERLRNILGGELDQLPADAVQALVTANIEGSVSNPRLKQFLEGHASDITKLLQDLVSRDLLIKEGYGRWATYRLSDRFSASGQSAQGTPDTEGRTPDTDPELLKLGQRARENKNLPAAELREVIQSVCLKQFLTPPVRWVCWLDEIPKGFRNGTSAHCRNREC